jgi:hypothetical protein
MTSPLVAVIGHMSSADLFGLVVSVIACVDLLYALLRGEKFLCDAELGLSALRWLLERVPAEIMILRPAPDDARRISANGLSGHFWAAMAPSLGVGTALLERSRRHASRQLGPVVLLPRPMWDHP